MNISNFSNLMTPKETAEALGVTLQTLSVWRCTKRYPIKYIKMGSKIFYRREDLQEFIESRIVGGESDEN